MTVANNHYAATTARRRCSTRCAAARGGLRSSAAAQTPRRRAARDLERGGLRIAFLGYSDVNPYGFNAGLRTPGTASADPAVVAADVAAPDSARTSSSSGSTGARAAPRSRPGVSGARRGRAPRRRAVVLGAHPHVSGGVETAARPKLVAWSLGNFVFPAHSADTSRTGILMVDLDRHGVRGWRVVHATIQGFRPVSRPGAGQ